ncbi:MAG: hypothetical protein PHV43_01775 [Candidatus Colwellbacteria bacterium]|nr:hypothetical protein [Candidatus Colwellbacteria bacterium]
MVYSRISRRKLERMLRRQAQKRSDDWCALGKVWLNIPERGFLNTHMIRLVVLEVEAPKPSSANWTIRGLVCNVRPLAFWSLECGAPYEIDYDPEEQTGTQERWRTFPVGATIGEMCDLALKLAR